MGNETLVKLANVIRRERDALLARWRAEVRSLPSAKHLDTPTLNDHVPALLEELAAAFQSPSDKTITDTVLEGSPPAHGLQRYEEGFDIIEVVAEYNVLRGCIYELAENVGFGLTGQAFHILNRVFDDAIGLAVQAFATQQALEVRRRREEYLAFVAHDLRTPLSAVALAAQVLEVTYQERGDSGKTAQMLRTLQRNVRHLRELVDDVLKESLNVATDGVELKRREFDLWPLVETVIHDLYPVAETGGTKLVNQIPEDLVVYADASLLKRVFQNLVANAITYTPRGEVILGASGADDSVECWVSDNGAGISEDRLQRIFDKGETDQQTRGGTGLGLAIVQTFVEAHGGALTVESRQGLGSTFRLTLPGKAKARLSESAPRT
jgi:two-component system phosphate regulon sensor histidine kinase PhoR